MSGDCLAQDGARGESAVQNKTSNATHHRPRHIVCGVRVTPRAQPGDGVSQTRPVLPGVDESGFDG